MKCEIRVAQWKLILAVCVWSLLEVHNATCEWADLADARALPEYQTRVECDGGLNFFHEARIRTHIVDALDRAKTLGLEVPELGERLFWVPLIRF